MASILNVPVKYDAGDFFSLLSLAAGASIARQNAMGALVIGDGGWRVDIRERRIYFGESAFGCGILGRESGGAWIWGWADKESGPRRRSHPQGERGAFWAACRSSPRKSLCLTA